MKWIDEVLDLALQFSPTPIVLEESDILADNSKDAALTDSISTH